MLWLYICTLLILISSRICHEDVMKWKHVPRYWPFVRGIHRSLVNSLHKGQWRGALMLSLNYAWTNRWVNNRDAGYQRRPRAHYDATAMPGSVFCIHNPLTIPWPFCWWFYYTTSTPHVNVELTEIFIKMSCLYCHVLSVLSCLVCMTQMIKLWTRPHCDYRYFSINIVEIWQWNFLYIR